MGRFMEESQGQSKINCVLLNLDMSVGKGSGESCFPCNLEAKVHLAILNHKFSNVSVQNQESQLLSFAVELIKTRKSLKA